MHKYKGVFAKSNFSTASFFWRNLMKIGIFNTVRGGSQRFESACTTYKNELELMDFGFPATDENAGLVKGCEAIIYTPWKPVSEKFWKTLSENGVQYVLTCTTGYDHFNLPLIKKYGMKAAYVPTYSPNAISEHTVMVILGILRNFKEQIHKVDGNDFRIPSKLGKEIRKQKIGIVGAGRIGLTTMKCLSGFGPLEILAYDLYEKEEVKQYARYVTLEELYKACDVIVFHCNLTEENYHLINDETIAKLKDGVCLVNVARGALFDTKAILRGVQSGKIGGLALDVIEEEMMLKGNQVFPQNPVDDLKALMEYENVIFTSHTAFYTETAYEDMSRTTIENAYEYKTTGNCKYELVK